MRPNPFPTDNRTMSDKGIEPGATATLIRSGTGTPVRRVDETGCPRCLVIMYHYVHDRFSGADAIPQEGKGVRGLSIRGFEAQLDRLTSQLEPLEWARFAAGMSGEVVLPDQSFLLTFDDGLREHAEVVLPILERHGLKGVFFVPGCVLSEPRVLSAHAVHLLLEALGEIRLLEEITKTLEGAGASLDLTEADELAAQKIYHYESAALARLKFLINMKLPLATRASVVGDLFERHLGPQQEWTKRWYLSREQVRELHSLGHTVGGHSYGHEPYGRLDDAALECDIRRSAKAIADTLGPDKRPFAYPFGSVHPRAAEFLGSAGFVAAFGTALRWVDGESPMMNLPRVDTIHVAAELQEATV